MNPEWEARNLAPARVYEHWNAADGYQHWFFPFWLERGHYIVKAYFDPQIPFDYPKTWHLL